jgi:hypothetical protein
LGAFGAFFFDFPSTSSIADGLEGCWLEDASGVDIQGVVEYTDLNNLKITFNQPVAGKAYLS